MSAIPHLSAEASAVLTDALASQADALQVIKDAQVRINALEADLAAKNVKIAQHESIVLEKVASARKEAEFRFNDKDVRETVAALADAGVIKHANITKVAADLSSNPTHALALLRGIASISESTNPQGFGMPRKTAAALLPSQADADEAEDWSVVVREGA